MKRVILVNKTKKPPKMLVFNLDINILAVTVENVILVKGADGKDRRKKITKRSPDSLRIPAGGQTLPLPEKILHCKEIKKAIRNREIVVLEIESENVAIDEIDEG